MSDPNILYSARCRLKHRGRLSRSPRVDRCRMDCNNWIPTDKQTGRCTVDAQVVESEPQ
jgi:hypothetical protein